MKGIFFILFLISCTNPGMAPDTRPAKVIDKNAINFIVMGDWGRLGTDSQKEVAVQMGKTAKDEGVDFIITTGDNFYPSGVKSEYDSAWKYSFEKVYTAASLQRNWYPALGNHDYGLNPDAEVAYSNVSERWKMPGRYYSRRININRAQQVLIVFIDTSPFVKDYYQGYGYAVNDQDTTAQKLWIEKELSDPSPNIKWRLVIGHHPMYTGGGRTEDFDTRNIRASLQSLFEKYNVDAYITGHEHSLQHLLVPGNKVNHFISGAGSEKTPVKMLSISKFSVSEYGFMLFSIEVDRIVVKVIDFKGSNLYETELTK